MTVPTLTQGLGFLVSLLIALGLVATKRWHGFATADGLEGIQKMHVHPTPRVGGLPIYIGLVCVYWTLPVNAEAHEIVGVLLLAGLPAFVFGLIEDLTKRVSVMLRLLATMASGLLGWWLTGHSIHGVGVWGLDYLLQWTWFSVAFSAFAIAGVANAFNIVDGMNGLAALSAMLMLSALAYIAHAADDGVLYFVILSLMFVVMGFFFVNWPWGKLFLGDGGAYFVGFAFAWLSVLLIQRNSSVSAFAPLLVCVHPVTEVLFSIYRRRKKEAHPGHPDRLHFHSLFNRRGVNRLYSELGSTQRNSVAGLLVGSMSAWSLFWVSWAYDSTVWCLLGIVLYVLLYVLLYLRMVRHRWFFKA